LCTLPAASTDAGTCESPAEIGYRYDVASGVCVRFVPGCNPNLNNFDNYEDCSHFCGDFEGVVAEAAIVAGADPLVSGHVTLSQASPQSPVVLRGFVRGLQPGLHGFHIHAVGNVGDQCKAAGTHFNPAMVSFKPLDSR
jgi:Cu/Zn superoxide dismutase